MVADDGAHTLLRSGQRFPRIRHKGYLKVLTNNSCSKKQFENVKIINTVVCLIMPLQWLNLFKVFYLTIYQLLSPMISHLGCQSMRTQRTHFFAEAPDYNVSDKTVISKC